MTCDRYNDSEGMAAASFFVFILILLGLLALGQCNKPDQEPGIIIEAEQP